MSKKLPKWLETGDYWIENRLAPRGQKRVIRALNGKRTHNINFDPMCGVLTWETSGSVEKEFEFKTPEEATKWWKKRFGGCKEATSKVLNSLRS